MCVRKCRAAVQWDAALLGINLGRVGFLAEAEPKDIGHTLQCLLDGQYTAEELEQRRGFGHSSPELGLKLMEQCKIGRLWLVHHDPQRTDGQLLAREEEYSRKNVHFAREGEEILL